MRLLNAYDIKCTGVTKGPGGGVTELACEFNAESLAFKVALRRRRHFSFVHRPAYFLRGPL